MKSKKVKAGKMLIIRLVLVALAGIAAHRTYEPTRIFGARWGSLIRYAIGIILFIPAQLVIKSGLPHNDHWPEPERDIVSGLLAAGATGTGVLIGHMLDTKE